ncbi:efflux RND transporter periplasmic adaptor subunit [Glaciimonas immobilis]|uniref:Cu(I)/Ag(I) efflux system membrane fusion protein n=1 Tax=Glaciimonas immobilis TaxID=728004 RepID=A0A840RZA6_9BURK|nr:efflux RND transporter periplasmic adaptor subunit [Glaciimonas immobilis]KAF3995979.1 efflux RND transporter periplasmic adaptor subunit [Glaciimonas immobilis]MBB5202448.1 Cu(I)/Ag(I) efflux system membrane fusion protein [Glaciimonas immobilis]
MKNRKILLCVVMVFLGASGYALYAIGIHQGRKLATSIVGVGASPVAASAPADAKKVLYWHDPMVPGQKFDKPGKSPFMDMQLVPVYAENGSDNGKVTISPRVQQNLGIRTAEVTRGNLTSAVVAVGSVAYNERDVALLQARSNGFVERLYVRAPLDPVRKGQALAQLYVPEWVAAQEEYLSVKRMQGNGLDGLLEGARQRMRLVGMTDDQIHLVETRGKVQARLTITAPIGGVLSELAVREGMTVMTGAPMFKINGLGTIWVNADIPESMSAQVRPGNAVEARTPALQGVIFKGKVSAILPDVNPATRTLKARIELPNPSGQLVPGMFATLNFSPAARKNLMLIPTEAVIQTGTRSVVMVAQGDGKFLPVEVEIGSETNGQSEIRKGLEVGQKVVVSGQFLIDSEASLTGTETRMSSMNAATPDKPTAVEPGKVAGPTHRGEGRVESINKEEITISHGPIPTLQWGAMTMGFKLPAGGLPHNIVVGDSVIFDIHPIKDGAFEIGTISPTAAAKNQSVGAKQ